MAIAIVMNIGIGQRVQAPHMPIYLDSIGTILVGALLGPWVGLISGVLSYIIWTLSGSNTHAWQYAPVVGVVGLLARFAGRMGIFRSEPPRFLSAIIGAVFVFNLSFIMLMFVTNTFISNSFLRWPVVLFENPANKLIFLMALVGGAILGYFVIRKVGYVGLAGLITGLAAAIVATPISTYVFDYNDINFQLRIDVIMEVF
jgi:hypothetical protein